MIKRHYFYHFVLQSDKPQFANGVIVARSWFADPDKAFGHALDFICDKWQCDRAKVRCEAFNAV